MRFFPFVASVHLFDAVTLALFRRTRAASTVPAQRALRARRRQTLIIALVCLAGATVGKVLADAASSSARS